MRRRAARAPSTPRRSPPARRGEREKRGPRLHERELLARAARIRLLLLDVDGVLTDGRVWYGPEGEALKAFDMHDGHGLVLIRDRVQLGVISGRPGKV